MNDNKSELTCGLNYEAEYYRLNEELEKMRADRDYLQEELKVCDWERHWLNGFKSAVEIIFGKRNNCE
jgi:hypothetical protein